MIWLALACADPALDPYARALRAWEEGRAALDAGDPAAAAARFAAARADDARSPVLALWEARALAAQGRLPDAERTLDAVIAAHPDEGLAWYNRAAYRARQGRLDAAGADLEAALRRGAASPFAAAADPDFAPHLAHPAFARLLPPAPLIAVAEGPTGPVWLDGQVEIVLRTRGLAALAPRLVLDGAAPPCLALERVVQEDAVDGEVATRVVTLRYRAVAACRVALGPWTVHAGAARVRLDALPVEVEAPEGRPAPPAPAHPSELPFPGSVPSPGALAVGGGALATAGPEAPPSRDGAAAPVGLEWRVGGQTRAVGGWWPGPGPWVFRAGDATFTVP